MQERGNCDPTAGHFALFLLHLFCSPYTLYTGRFHQTMFYMTGCFNTLNNYILKNTNNRMVQYIICDSDEVRNILCWYKETLTSCRPIVFHIIEYIFILLHIKIYSILCITDVPVAQCIKDVLVALCINRHSAYRATQLN